MKMARLTGAFRQTGGRTRLLLALVFRPLAVHPSRDGAARREGVLSIQEERVTILSNIVFALFRPVATTLRLRLFFHSDLRRCVTGALAFSVIYFFWDPKGGQAR